MVDSKTLISRFRTNKWIIFCCLLRNCKTSTYQTLLLSIKFGSRSRLSGHQFEQIIHKIRHNLEYTVPFVRAQLFLLILWFEQIYNWFGHWKQWAANLTCTNTFQHHCSIWVGRQWLSIHVASSKRKMVGKQRHCALSDVLCLHLIQADSLPFASVDWLSLNRRHVTRDSFLFSICIVCFVCFFLLIALMPSLSWIFLICLSNIRRKWRSGDAHFRSFDTDIFICLMHYHRIAEQHLHSPIIFIVRCASQLPTNNKTVKPSLIQEDYCELREHTRAHTTHRHTDIKRRKGFFF